MTMTAPATSPQTARPRLHPLTRKLVVEFIGT